MIAAIWVTIAAVVAGVLGAAASGAWQRLNQRLDDANGRLEFLCDRIERLERKP